MRYIAVIDIGSTAIRMTLMELTDQERIQDRRVLEQAERTIPLGKDIFETGRIQSSTLQNIIQHIRAFQELYSIYSPDDVILLGSYALREATNRELFQDRILLETGLSIRLLGGMETNQLRFLALSRALEGTGLSLEKGQTLIVDIGSSSTEVMYLEDGNMTWSDTLQIGILRETSRFQLSPEQWGEDLEEHIRLNTGRVLLQFTEEYKIQGVTQLIMMGRDIQVAAPHVGERSQDGSFIIKGDDFRRFLDSLKGISSIKIMERFGLSYQKASALLPALYIGEIMFEKTSAESLIVPPATAVEGIFLQAASSSTQLKQVFRKQIQASAWSMAKHYHIDQHHARFVRDACLKIYEFICREKKMDMQYSIILETAAILHDIGSYVSGSSHHKHGQYLINSSTIFGLTNEQKGLVGHVVRYHRRNKPHRSHRLYMSLPRESRIIVQKLAAVLRVADALDRSHRQRIHFSMSLEGNRMILHSQNNVDVTMERQSLKEKGDMFYDIFGIKILLG